MRMSCNGCRVLRKGCSEDCTIRPCLQWIKSPEAQANATVFLAKFYGRAGLINLVNAGPQHLRPAIFRSLLYEACGRIVNPIYGSVGLLWSGSWQLCQAAVETVLKGGSIAQMSADAAVAAGVPGHKPYDIRHVVKNSDAGAGGLHRVAAKSRARFKRSGAAAPVVGAELCYQPPARSQESNGDSGCSAETAEGSHISQGEPGTNSGSGAPEAGEVGMGLNLSLSLESSSVAPAAAGGGCVSTTRQEGDARRVCRVELGLSLTS